MALTHVQFLEVFPFHEPFPLIPSFSPSGGEGARRAVEWDSDRFMASIHVRILEVSPTHEPQPSSSSSTGRLGFEDEDDDEGEPVHGANARRKSRGRSPARRERVEGQLS